MKSMALTIPARLSFATISLVLVLSACARPPGPGKVGDRLEYKGYRMTVTNVETAKDFPGARRASAGEHTQSWST